MSLIIDLLYPIRCFGCNRLGCYICPDCQDKLSVLPIRYNPDTDLDGTLSLFRYRFAIRRLIHALKYQFASDTSLFIATLIANYLVAYFPHLLDYWQQHKFALVPIPLHWKRQNWRGFNQSNLIAYSLSSLIGLPYLPALIRQRHTPSQAALRFKSQRLSNVTSAFSLHSSTTIPSNIILFDDVITTGATIQQAANVLKQSGANSVWSLSLAG